ncbi:MAG: DUF327 family protein [Spirochaetales bacterium]|nr:DUF327 family protein [Spirochaetales bacterium]
MERIDVHGSFFQIPSSPPRGKKKQEKSGRSGKTFFSLLNPETGEPEKAPPSSAVDGDVTQLSEALDAVHEAGEKLKRDPTLNSVGAYKNAVRNFLKIVTDACYRIEVHEKRKNNQDSPAQQILRIRVVDEKLEKLASRIMAGQRDQLEILRRVDEIYGVLVDLLQ